MRESKSQFESFHTQWRLWATLRLLIVVGCLLSSSAAAGAEEEREDEVDYDALLMDDERDDAGAYETVVSGYRVRPTDQTTGFAETIEVEEESQSVNSVSEVLTEAVGLHVRQLGGLGSFGTASIRGSTSSQVPIFLDGVQLNAGGFPTVDLGDLTLDSIAEIEVYRGGAPVSLGTSGIGGAISLRTRQFERPLSQTALSFGSWNSARFFGLHGNRIGPVRVLALLTAQTSEGDFYYLNRNGTTRDTLDDGVARRQNNGHTSFDGLLKLDGPVGRWEWMLLNDLFVKQQGIPGIESIPTQSASLGTLRNAATLGLSGPVSETFALELKANYLTMREEFDDSLNEVGLGHQRVRSRGDVVGAQGVGLLDWNDHHLTTIRLAGRYERFTQEDLLQEHAGSPKWRTRVEAGLQHDWKPIPAVLLSPAIRYEYEYSRFSEVSGSSAGMMGEGSNVDEQFWSPSIGGRFEIVTGLFVRANGGRYVRTPDLAELFGDRGAVVGNPKLKPEVGINADAGLTYIRENLGPLDLLRLDAAWFGSWTENLIAYVQNSQNTVRPENVDAARILGAESAFRLVLLRALALEGNYTYLHGVNLSDKPYHWGKRLPGRPVHEVYGKIEARKDFAQWGGALWVDGDYAGRNYLDQANLREDVLGRLFFGTGVRVAHPKSGLTFTFQMKNLANRITARDGAGPERPIRDFAGFPLPGRTVFATLHWSN